MGGASGPGPDLRGSVRWSVVFAVLSSFGLAALAWGLLVMEALVAMGVALVSPDADVGVGGRYGWALAIGIVVNLIVAPLLALSLRRTPARAWTPWLQGLASAGVAALVSGAVLLAVVGISPIAFVSGL